MRGFLDAAIRLDASHDARLLSLIAVGSRVDSKNLDQTLDRLTDQAKGQ